MKMNVINQEINRRIKKHNDEHNVVGAEIRQQRLEQSKTLDATVSKICSLSYLCKIERNAIRPNKKIIRDVCTRLNIDDEKVDTLHNLRSYVYNSAIAYLNRNIPEIENIVCKTRGFQNYRSMIIDLIKSILDKDFEKSIYLDRKIFKLISTMNNNDLMVFFIFHAILAYYRQSFIEACDLFNSIISGIKLPSDLLALVYIYLLKCELKTNNHDINYTYIVIRDLLINNGHYDKLDEINYFMCLYYLKNKMYKRYSMLYASIKDKTYRNTLLIFVKLIFNPKQNISDRYYKDCRRSANLLYYYYKNADLYNVISEKITDADFDVDFNPLYFHYLSLKTDMERFNFIVEIGIKALKLSYDAFVAQFLLDELSRLSYIHSRYKAFQTAYQDIRSLQ
jgi:hypothetical protein